MRKENVKSKVFVEIDRNNKPEQDENDASQNSENISENANSVLESQASVDADLYEKKIKTARRLTCKEIFCCSENKNIII